MSVYAPRPHLTSIGVKVAPVHIMAKAVEIKSFLLSLHIATTSPLPISSRDSDADTFTVSCNNSS